MVTTPDIREIHYVRPNGEERKANIVPVEFPASGLSQEELAVLDALSSAIDGITPIFAQQQDTRALAMFKALADLEGIVSGPEQAKLADFNTLFAVRNAPFDLYSLGLRFPIDASLIPTGHPILNYQDLLSGNFTVPPGRGLYPHDITDAEFEALGDLKNTVNSTVVRLPNGSLEVVLNEHRFRRELENVIKFLEAAKSKSTNPTLNAYVQSKIDELRTGISESRRKSDMAWLQNSGSIDFVIGTGVETYLDQFKGARGTALGAVFTIDRQYESLSSKLLGLLPELEERAPWKHKKKVDVSNLPRLRYVNVLTWVGYNMFPQIVEAQSLPNDREVVDKHGSVNMVFVNIQKALARGGGMAYISEEFLPKDEMKKYSQYMPDTKVFLVAIHELGHTTGGSLIEEPRKHFGEEYSRLEEARCDLFSLWALPTLVQRGIISREQEIAGYYFMLAGMVNDLQFEPRDHHGARNMMFHYFLEKRAVVEREEDGRIKYAVNPENMRAAVESMLAALGDIRATGDIDGLRRFKDEYLSSSDQEHFKKRLEKKPLGWGIIFPMLEHSNGMYTGNLIYPGTFREQPRTLGHFI